MRIGIVNAEAIMKSGRLDAEFHLRGQKLKAVCEQRVYSVEVTVDEFTRIIERDKNEPIENTLYSRLQRMGAFGIEYHAHFGPYVTFTLNAEDDKPTRESHSPGLRERICREIRDYIRNDKETGNAGKTDGVRVPRRKSKAAR